MTTYTLTTDEVREVFGRSWYPAAFDRWKADYTKEVLDKAVERVSQIGSVVDDRISPVEYIRRSRALAAIRGEGESNE